MTYFVIRVWYCNLSSTIWCLYAYNKFWMIILCLSNRVQVVNNRMKLTKNTRGSQYMVEEPIFRMKVLLCSNINTRLVVKSNRYPYNWLSCMHSLDCKTVASFTQESLRKRNWSLNERIKRGHLIKLQLVSSEFFCVIVGTVKQSMHSFIIYCVS